MNKIHSLYKQELDQWVLSPPAALCALSKREKDLAAIVFPRRHLSDTTYFCDVLVPDGSGHRRLVNEGQEITFHRRVQIDRSIIMFGRVVGETASTTAKNGFRLIENRYRFVRSESTSR